MKSKIRVYGKSQSRTALGIINAYLKLYPDATLFDLRRAFPKSLNPKSFTEHLIVPEKETKGQEKQFFEREDELIVLKTGERLALVEVWSKDDFDAICEHAKQYGIEVAEFEGTKPFEKGSFELEYLNDFVPPGKNPVPPRKYPPVPEVHEEKKRRFGWWWWLILLLLLLLLLLFCWKKCCPGNKCSTSTVPPIENKSVPVENKDTTPVISVDSVKEVKAKPDSLFRDLGDSLLLLLPGGKEWKIWKGGSEYKLFTFLNSADAKVDPDKTKGWIVLDRVRFKTGDAILTSEAEKQLKNIAMIMSFFPNSRIKMGGHADNTGSDAINIKLSTARAKVAADKLISFGVDAGRVSYEGYSYQYPVCPENNTTACRAANRRVDVKVTQK